MKTLRSISFVLFMFLVAAGASQAQDSRISTEAAVQPEGYVRLTVTNNSNQPITALYVVGEGTPLVQGIARVVSMRYMDSYVNMFSDKDLLPSQSRTFVLGGPQPGPERLRTEISLKAAIFADGTSFGDPSGVQHLIQRRAALLKYVQDAIKTLKAAKGAGVTRDQLKAEIQQTRLAESNAAQSREAKTFANGVYSEVLADLHIDDVRVPPEPVNQRIDSIISQLNQRQDRLEKCKPPLS